MEKINEAKLLLSKGDYIQAGRMLDRLLGKDRANDELWYLRALASLKLKNYDYANECLEHALWISKKSEYFKLKAMAYMESYRFEEAIDELNQALAIDKKNHFLIFLLAICLIFLKDPRSKDFMEKAYLIDPKKTSEMLKNFYNIFLKKDILLSQKTRESIEERISNIS